MKKSLMITTAIILMLCTKKELNKITIPDSSIRVRVIANSNSIEDQLNKLKVKKEIENTLYNNLKNIKNINEARVIIKKSIPSLNNKISKKINNNFNINYGTNYFPKKEMYGITYEEGNYESIVVNIGEGKGNNWWCVLFPPICMIEVEEQNHDEIKYKSKVLEIINSYK